MAKLDIKKIDKAMGTNSKGIDGMDWYTADSSAFELSGFYWRTKGDSNIYFLDGMRLYGQDFAECTVDGAHATDLGFYRMAHTTGPIIESILSKWWF